MYDIFKGLSAESITSSQLVCLTVYPIFLSVSNYVQCNGINKRANSDPVFLKIITGKTDRIVTSQILRLSHCYENQWRS